MQYSTETHRDIWNFKESKGIQLDLKKFILNFSFFINIPNIDKFCRFKLHNFVQISLSNYRNARHSKCGNIFLQIPNICNARRFKYNSRDDCGIIFAKLRRIIFFMNDPNNVVIYIYEQCTTKTVLRKWRDLSLAIWISLLQFIRMSPIITFMYKIGGFFT